jgi:hypothetical protein
MGVRIAVAVTLVAEGAGVIVSVGVRVGGRADAVGVEERTDVADAVGLGTKVTVGCLDAARTVAVDVCVEAILT